MDAIISTVFWVIVIALVLFLVSTVKRTGC